MNNRIPESPPIIEPLQEYDGRPLWSVMIPTYNCINYVRQAIESVLIQDEGADLMQIEVIDDCSTDGDIEQLVKEIGRGRVGFFRQEKNRGSLRNFETCINRAKGRWVHILHGDDAVKPGFYREVKGLFTEYPDIGAAITGFSMMDEYGNVYREQAHIRERKGIIEDWLDQIAIGQQLNPPAIVVKRTVYEKLGSFFAVHYGEDWEMWVRIAAHYQVGYVPKHLALYRTHSNNITSRFFGTGQNIKDIEKVIDIIQHYLPVNKRKELKKVAKRNFSAYFAKTAHKIADNRQDFKIAFTQAYGALRMQANKATVRSLIKLYVKYLRYLLSS